MNKPPLTLLLASPRGFCAGVERAIEIVQRALEKFGAPVYVRHEIVHNRHVVDALEAKGAIFVDELDEVLDLAFGEEIRKRAIKSPEPPDAVEAETPMTIVVGGESSDDGLSNPTTA